MGKLAAFEMHAVKEPLRRVEREVAPPAAGNVVVRVAGCGVCHTDVSFWHDGVRTRHALPLVLGHEISGVVEDASRDAEHLRGQAVIVPAVIPCGRCDACRDGRGNICPKQIFPGNDIHGGFATHVEVPAHGLCVVPGFTGDADAPLARSGVSLRELSVLADAISTPWQSITRSGLRAGDVAVFVGAGGVGGFGVQLAAALGARVAALDVDDGRLAAVREHGAACAVNVRGKSAKDVRKELSAWAASAGAPATRWKIFETSGTAAGQETAFALLNHGAYLGIVGFTMDTVSVRLSNLMAFDARAEGTWGCVPDLYPSALDLCLDGRVRIAPFVERHPLASVNDVLAAAVRHELKRRPVLVP
ncbi:MAG: 6-hydroxycyclohex-1-ene-1-carbonyl-CoA dehydrogenase [Planctomycetes bacterium]|nr:6-hydroxycyclohex-1-ene-1-carbonyl-CoA dehydrogenase [Planctomycetota bacterium]